VGGQVFSSIFLFVAFYCVSAPIGLGLLLGTSLGVAGFYIGVFIGLVVLVALQFAYIYRINWYTKSIEVFSNVAFTNTLIEFQTWS
jgi:hypothetical protein